MSKTTPPPAPEPVRLLLPSALGALGIEIVDETLTRVVIVPRGRERSRFRPFAKLKRSERSDFLDEILGRFSEFLAGARRNLDIPYDLGPSGLTGFDKRILKETAKIRYARTRTYQQIAAAAGNSTAYRQVLSILLANPLPLVIPCHRVVTVKSGPGSWIGGTKKKARLLKMEQRGLAV
ncbi:MAG: methylated-DNA--[protein]-cysteine S-methyltransferase [Acidobacteriota bacterium]|nr:methylated-DNA--[protein]-cysteine S-methyltransferase [Acidobacteriota bacterium]